MFWKKQTRQGVGKSIRAPMLNELQRAVEAHGRLRALPPLGITQTPGAALLYWSGALLDVGYFIADDAIPAMEGSTFGSGQATQYYRDKTDNTLVTTYYDSVTIYNWTPATVGANGNILICIAIAGDWTVIAEACPSGGG